MTAITFLALLLIPGYIILYISISLYYRKKSKGFHSFATAHKMLPPWLIGIGAGATLASANLFIGVPGWAYQYGYPTGWWILGNTVTISIGLLLFAPRFLRFYRQRHFEHCTMPHWLGDFYGSRALRLAVAIFALFNIYYLAGQNIGLATILEQLVGMPYKWGVAICVATVASYTLFGGRYAGILTDAIQLTFKSITGIIVFVSLFSVFGSGALGIIHSGLAAQDPQLVSYLARTGVFSDWVSIACIQWLLFAFVLLPHFGSIVLGLEREEDLKPFLIAAILGFFFSASFMWFGGLAARVLYPGLPHPDSAIPVYVIRNFSPIVTMIIIGGMMAAVMSVADSLYIELSSTIANDILWMIPKEKKMIVAKASILVVGLVSLFISLQRPKSLTLFTQFGISAIISGIAVLIGYAHFGKRRIPSWGALLIFFTGSGTYLALTISGLFANIFKALGVASLASLLILACILLFVKTGRRI